MHQTGRVLEGHNQRQHGRRRAASKASTSIPISSRPSSTGFRLRQRQCKWPVMAEWERVKRKDLLTRHFAPVARQSDRRPDVPACQGLPLRQAVHRHAEGRAPATARAAAGADPQRLRHRLRLVGPARACRRLRHDRRHGAARPREFRDLRLLLRHQPDRMRRRRESRAASITGSTSTDSATTRRRRRSRPTASIFSSTSTATPRTRAPRCSRAGRRRSCELVRLSQHDGNAVSPLSHRR